MKQKIKELEINGEKYILASQVKERQKVSPMCENYFIVRTYSAGVFAGEIEKREGKEVHMRNARRLWRWYGASSLSQLAMEGVKKPDDCMFPCELDEVILTEVIEICRCTEEAQESIKGVKVWEQK